MKKKKQWEYYQNLSSAEKIMTMVLNKSSEYDDDTQVIYDRKSIENDRKESR